MDTSNLLLASARAATGSMVLNHDKTIVKATKNLGKSKTELNDPVHRIDEAERIAKKYDDNDGTDFAHTPSHQLLFIEPN